MNTTSIHGHYTEDHDRLGELFRQFQTLKSSDRVKAAQNFQEFKSGLEQHIVREEEILFPSFETAHCNLHNELKRLDRLTKTLAKENSAENPNVLIIRKCFVAFQRRFKAHLRKESEQLFPACRRWATSRNESRHARFFLKSSLPQLEREHRQAEEALADLRSMVAGDAPSSAAQVVVQSIAGAVARLEHIVHEQIYKENQVLYPRALALGGS